ncbi:hypothetical protein FIBSPDRAFT_105813 [Athelia psychrophila]|uniref:Uncharacterized protein n=1 Tax=Athelia psychrophila TaxID=1759441 RepID=A0A166DBX8_9AGAM|nr:hypothetical protein FIBSPDRAFT_105813 [Fibularhizoctonia sp. CBS 109695]
MWGMTFGHIECGHKQGPNLIEHAHALNFPRTCCSTLAVLCSLSISLDRSMPTSDESPKARARRSFPRRCCNNSRVRSGIWYDDGSVTLQAEGIQYKIYGGILVQSFSVFNVMFSFPQPPSATTELVGGCLIVHLSNLAQGIKYFPAK